MKTSTSITRRNFIEKAAVTAGLTALGTESLLGAPAAPNATQGRLPREVWIATVSQHRMSAETPEKMTEAIFAVLKNCLSCSPDVICLPEIFMTANISARLSLQERTDVSYKLLREFTAFAKTNNCYVICPMFTRENGKIFNSAVVIDRRGSVAGEYRKIHLTEGEVADGVTPGPLLPPVFKTDFGVVGIQICFDIEWDDGWTALEKQGAEIVFWPSAFAGGQAVNGKAWQHRYNVVSSTWKDTTKICDITGETVIQTGHWDRNIVCAPVNLEKAFLHSWPYALRFDEIRAKYGRKVRFQTFHEEEWSVIESLSPEVRVKDILAEFKLRTYEQLMNDSEKAQIKARG
jgi:predicted amidohydrolase